MNMNVKQVRTHMNLTSLKPMLSRTPIEFDGGDASFKKSGKGDSWMLPTDYSGIKVLIVSCNSFVTDFLRGLVEAHGYESEVVADFRKAQARVENGWPHAVFIDDSCLEMEDSKNFELRTRNLIKEGVPVILLANEQTKHHIEGLPAMEFFQVVEKPVGYAQIGQVISDLTNA